MRRVFLVGLVSTLALVGACRPCPTLNCAVDCPVVDSTTTAVRPKVDVVILPLPTDSTVRCVTVDRAEHCRPGQMEKELPAEGQFELFVDGDLYAMDAYSPDRVRLETVYVVVGSKYVVGVYADETLAVAAETGTCRTCPNGTTVCGHNPRCK